MRIFLAPMEGVVDYAMRCLMREIGGIDVCVTEFVRVSSSLLPDKTFLRYCPELSAPAAIPTRVQLLGSDAEMMARNAAKAASLGASAIDLNFGCPAKTVNRHQGGACLLDSTQSIFVIVKAVRDAVPQSTPVTAKIRLGYHDRLSYLDNAIAIEEAGASELVVHARSKQDGYNPPAYWSYLADINERLKIPVVANGELWSVEDYLRCRAESGCEDMMLGRGLLAQPDLALAIKAMAQHCEHRAFTWQDITPYLLGYFLESSAHYPEKYMGNRVKQWLHYLKRSYPQAQRLFDQIKKSRDAAYIAQCIQCA